MLKDYIKIHELTGQDEFVKVEEVNINELLIFLPILGFKFKINTPLFNIEGISPVQIMLVGITSDEFKIKINTAEFNFVTVVPSLVLEVFNPKGVRIIKIVAPSE